MKKDNLITHFNVEEIKDPKFLKDLSYKELDVLSNDIRKEIIEVTSKTGGHLSSNLGVVELTIALHRNFDFLKDTLLFDVGHQCYTHKILTGRSIKNIRQDDGLCGFQKMEESPYDKYEAGHSSTVISVATGLAISKDVNDDSNIVCLIGDSSIVNGLALEGLNNLSQINNKVIIILNDNDMSISKPSGGFSKFFRKMQIAPSYTKHKNRFTRVMNKTRFGAFLFKITRKFKNKVKSWLIPTTLFDNLGFAYLGPIDGHNFKALDKALKSAIKSSKSIVLHVKTKKGKGYDPAENDKDGSWHGVTPFVVETGEFVTNDSNNINWSKLFSNKVDELLNQNEDLYLISAATLKGSCLDELHNKYHKRVIDVGIAEEHAVTAASGLLLNNKKVIISMYSTFLQRAFDEIHHDISRLNLKPLFLIDRSGLVGQDGETHQGIYDESFLYTIPNTYISMPSNEKEASYLLNLGLNNDFDGPMFIRYPRGYCSNFDNVNLEDGVIYSRNLKHVDNKDLLIITVGPHSNELVNIINNENINAEIDLMLFVKPIDKKILNKALEYKTVIVYNPYSTRHGFVNNFVFELNKFNFKNNIITFEIPDEYIKYGSYSTQLKNLKLSPIDIVEKIKNL